jgi:hypothetical protein
MIIKVNIIIITPDRSTYYSFSQGVIIMTVNVIPAKNTSFKAGWIVLLVSAALFTLGHLSLIFVFANEQTLFIGHTAFNLYAFLVILIPFHEGKKWAWLATWILPVGLALTGAFDAQIAPYYFGMAAVCALGLLLTMRPFFSSSKSI